MPNASLLSLRERVRVRAYSVNYQAISNEQQLLDYCRRLAGCESIAFDTEFVSEHTYRPVLCLVQVAAAGELAIIDAMTIDDMTPFWETLVAPGHETIVHAGRGEVEFCLQAIGRPPAGLFDVQLAAAFAGIEYPAGFATLVAKVLREPAAKHETRTDWRRRPLSQRQIEYALEDAHYLHPLHDELRARLEKLGRLDWFAEEMAAWLDDVRRASSEDRWRRVSSNASLNARSQAVVRELSRWREREAERRNQPVRRVLRDDLIIELARRQTADVKRIRAVRGMERGDLQRRMDEIAACIQKALALPEEQWPPQPPREPMPQLAILGQILFAALGNICRQAHLAPNLVGTPNDIRELVTYDTCRTKENRPKPRLAQGWREKFVGCLFDELLSGKVAIRIGDPAADCPLVFEPEKGEVDSG
jgi:ribonuclease D